MEKERKKKRILWVDILVTVLVVRVIVRVFVPKPYFPPPLFPAPLRVSASAFNVLQLENFNVRTCNTNKDYVKE